MKTVSRREMLASTAGAGITGAAALSLSPRPTFAAEESGLESGLIYLNTGSLGPTPRSVLDAVMKAWAQLETNPVVMAYGAGAAHALADRTREAAAGLIRCAADEVLLTRSTTNAMNIAALGIDLAAGDRVLTTDSEHEGAAPVGSISRKALGHRHRSCRDFARRS